MRSERWVKNILAVILSFVFVNTLAYANDFSPISYRHGLNFGLQTMSFDYQEPTLDVGISGLMHGLSGGYTYHHKDIVVEAEIELSLGMLEYDGWISDGTTRSPVNEDSQDFLLESRWLIGCVYSLKKNKFVTIYSGLGYRYWNNDIEGSGSYEREIGYLYMPIGVQIDHPLSNNWRWGASIEYDFFLHGQVTSHLSDVNPGYNDLENDQDVASGYGVRCSLRFSRKLTRNHTLTIEPFIRYWDIDTSDTTMMTYYGTPVGIGWEPENETTTYGLRCVLGYQFPVKDKN